MKKKILTFLIPTAAVALIGSLISKPILETNASITEKTVIFDSFNSSEYRGTLNNNIWNKAKTAETIAQSTNGYTYLSQSGASKGTEFYSFSTKEKLHNIRSLQFDVWFADQVNPTDGKWFSPYFVTEKGKELLGEDKGGCAYSGLSRISYNQINMNYSAFTMDVENTSLYNFQPKLGINTTKNWITIRFDITSENTASVNACAQGGEFDSSKAVSFTYSSNFTNLTDAYVVLGASNASEEIRIDNVIIENDTITINENFDSCDLNDEDCPFEINCNPAKDIKDTTYSIVDNCVLEFNNSVAGDYIYTKNPVVNLTSGIEDINIFTLSFRLKIANKMDKFGIVFGYNSAGGLTNNTVVYEISKNNGVLKEYDSNGVQTTTDASNTNSFTYIGNEAEISISFSKKNGVSITENGSSVRYNNAYVTFENVSKYIGNIALVTLNRSSNTSNEFYLDQFKVVANSYYKPITKSVTHTFNYPYWGNGDLLDFYAKGTPEESLYCKNGKLVFDCASDNTFFGSAHQYDDFIMDFKICSIHGDATKENSNSLTAADKWIGLDISRPNLKYSSYGSYLTCAVVITPKPELNVANAWYYAANKNAEYYNTIVFNKIREIPASLFRDITYATDAGKDNIKEGDAVCFRYVSENGKLSLYLKKACELNYVKYFTYSNIDIQGYFALTCTGYTSLEIDDFSMANTSSIYECADTYIPEPIVETYTEVIYDNQNNDINLEEEITLNLANAGGCGGSIFAEATLLCLVSAIGVVIIVLRKRKVCVK